MFYGSSRFIVFLLLKLFFRFKIYGKENIPKSGGLIIASNHLSYFDPPVLGAGATRKLRFLARDNLFELPLLSVWLKSVGVIAIRRNTADFSGLRNALKCIKNGDAVGLFPEGRRSEDGRLKEPLSGISFLAAKAGAVVIPAFIKGTENVLPKGAKRVRFKPIAVYFGKPIQIERDMDHQDVARLIMESIRKLSS